MRFNPHLPECILISLLLLFACGPKKAAFPTLSHNCTEDGTVLNGVGQSHSRDRARKEANAAIVAKIKSSIKSSIVIKSTEDCINDECRGSESFKHLIKEVAKSKYANLIEHSEPLVHGEQYIVQGCLELSRLIDVVGDELRPFHEGFALSAKQATAALAENNLAAFSLHFNQAQVQRQQSADKDRLIKHFRTASSKSRQLSRQIEDDAARLSALRSKAAELRKGIKLSYRTSDASLNQLFHSNLLSGGFQASKGTGCKGNIDYHIDVATDYAPIKPNPNSANQYVCGANVDLKIKRCNQSSTEEKVIRLNRANTTASISKNDSNACREALRATMQNRSAVIRGLYGILPVWHVD